MALKASLYSPVAIPSSASSPSGLSAGRSVGEVVLWGYRDEADYTTPPHLHATTHVCQSVCPAASYYATIPAE
ncbi:hypothetical protein E2C01_054347 [Portunus trituberculatus]|uniref:Uncharacterized protein n=1 Tax=Portunus trituberculatus TaxID=210409 RepID=A0A5B7GRQ8_PORTR|nr:hypothetical protein [Portunus trituberculatus]